MTQAPRAKVGILIPTYNRREYLSRAIESAVRQTHEPLEIVVIDNGSTDGTADLMASVRDPRVRYFVNARNLGMAGSINAGVLRFSDEVRWCSILSDDDFFDSRFIERLLTAASETNARAVVHSHRVFVDQHGGRIREARSAPCEETALHFLDMRSRARRETYLTGVLFDRAAFGAIGGYPVFRTGLASDDAFIFALALRDRLVSDRDAVAFIRVHPGAESQAASDGLAKLETVEDFCAYCRREMAARTDPGADERRAFDHSLRRYRTLLNSFWWRTTMHAILDGRGGCSAEQAAILRSLVAKDPAAFSPRIRLNVRLENATRLNPERSRAYRVIGKAFDYLVFGMSVGSQ